MVLHKEGVNGMVDEKVTVISSVVTYIRMVHTKAKLEVGNGISANFFVTEAGNASPNDLQARTMVAMAIET